MSNEEKAASLKILLDMDETFCDPESMFETSFRNVSFSRGSERNSSKRNTRGMCSFHDIFDSDTPVKRLSFGKSDISDSDFFDSDKGKELILKDQELMEKELTLQNNDVNCTTCSLWVPVTSKKISDLPKDIDISNGQLNISVGEYIAIRTENLGSLSNSRKQKPSFGFNTSTPACATYKSATSSTDDKIKVLDDFSKLKISHNPNDYSPTCGVPLLPKILYSVTPKKRNYDCLNRYYNNLDDFSDSNEHSLTCDVPLFSNIINSVTPKKDNSKGINDYLYYISSTCYKNIQRLRAEERMRAQKWQWESSGSETNRPEDLKSNSNAETSQISDSRETIEQWLVQPEELEISPAKGNRVVLINNSKKELKFKVKFDVHFINVSPVSGTVLAKGQIGLRILTIRTPRRQRESVVTNVKVIIGNREKTVHVKILEEKKSNTLKDRSYISY